MKTKDKFYQLQLKIKELEFEAIERRADLQDTETTLKNIIEDRDFLLVTIDKKMKYVSDKMYILSNTPRSISGLVHVDFIKMAQVLMDIKSLIKNEIDKNNQKPELQ